MDRQSFIGGNWKCNGTPAAVSELVSALKQFNLPQGVDVCVAPPALYLLTVKQELPGYLVGAQNCSATGNGAFTGEISAVMLKDVGINWGILGHSERRAETESCRVVGEKVKRALAAGLGVIVCIGETLEERKSGRTLSKLSEQLKSIAANVSDWSKVVVAYEPIWAIGTGLSASPEQAQEVHAGLRSWVRENVSSSVGQRLRLIYGGSVTSLNAAGLKAMPDIDGFLVGGASLKANDFTAIVTACSPRARL